MEVYEECRTSLSQAKFLNCKQILGHVADLNYSAFMYPLVCNLILNDTMLLCIG